MRLMQKLDECFPLLLCWGGRGSDVLERPEAQARHLSSALDNTVSSVFINSICSAIKKGGCQWTSWMIASLKGGIAPLRMCCADLRQACLCIQSFFYSVFIAMNCWGPQSSLCFYVRAKVTDFWLFARKAENTLLNFYKSTQSECLKRGQRVSKVFLLGVGYVLFLFEVMKPSEVLKSLATSMLNRKETTPDMLMLAVVATSAHTINQFLVQVRVLTHKVLQRLPVVYAPIRRQANLIMGCASLVSQMVTAQAIRVLQFLEKKMTEHDEMSSILEGLASFPPPDRSYEEAFWLQEYVQSQVTLMYDIQMIQQNKTSNKQEMGSSMAWGGSTQKVSPSSTCLEEYINNVVEQQTLKVVPVYWKSVHVRGAGEVSLRQEIPEQVFVAVVSMIPYLKNIIMPVQEIPLSAGEFKTLKKHIDKSIAAWVQLVCVKVFGCPRASLAPSINLEWFSALADEIYQKGYKSEL